VCFLIHECCCVRVSVVVLEYTLPHCFITSVLEEQRNPLESRLIGGGICHRL
jgi:hypothetical protein